MATRTVPISIINKLRCRRYFYVPVVTAGFVAIGKTRKEETFKLQRKKSFQLSYCYPANCFPLKVQRNLHTQITSMSTSKIKKLNAIDFDKLSNETLDELAEYFEDLGDSGLCCSDYDVSLSAGVLTINVGDNHGSYVINKQSPNQQIWLSSPKSGPKRYDVIDGRWRYSHDGEALHDLLQKEFSEILDTEVDLSQLRHSYLVSDEGNWAN